MTITLVKPDTAVDADEAPADGATPCEPAPPVEVCVYDTDGYRAERARLDALLAGDWAEARSE